MIHAERLLFLASAPLFYFERVITMKKWMLLFIAAVVVLIVAVIGGGFSNDAEPATLREPPQLVVEDGEASVEALRGTYSWHYGQGDKGVGTDADSVHPLDAKDTMTPLVVKRGAEATTVQLTFDVAPDAVSARAWDTAYWGQAAFADAQGLYESVPVQKNDQGEWLLTLLEEDAVYGISAEWNRFENFGGEAFYSFYTQSQP